MSQVGWVVYHILAAVGAMASIYAGLRGLQLFRRVSWRKVERMVLRLCEDLRSEDFKPTLIMGIGRGGAVLGALISGVFGHVPLIVIERHYNWTNGEGRATEIEMPEALEERLERVLLVAGEVHTGNTMSLCLRSLREMGAGDVRTYALQCEQVTIFRPDECGIIRDGVIHLPWMLTRNYRKLDVEPPGKQ